MSAENENQVVSELLIQLQNLMRARATHQHAFGDDELYIDLRQTLMRIENIRSRLPISVRTCRTLDVFWEFIRDKYGTYAERRRYLREEFEPLIQRLEDFDTELSNDLTYADETPFNENTQKDIPSNSSNGQSDPRSVFIIHGRNEVLKKSMFDFLRSVDLKPLEWSHLVASTGSGSPYVQEVLEKALVQAQAIVVMLTPDDDVRLRSSYHRKDEPDYEKTLMGQARPNVLLEAGMAIALNRERTIFVEVGNLRPISDIAGIHTVRFDGSANSRHSLASRLKVAGCAVDTDHNQDWLSVGNFQIT